MAMSRVYTDAILVRLKPEERAAIAAVAENERRPVAAMARMLIERGLAMTALSRVRSAKEFDATWRREIGRIAADALEINPDWVGAEPARRAANARRNGR